MRRYLPLLVWIVCIFLAAVWAFAIRDMGHFEPASYLAGFVLAAAVIGGYIILYAVRVSDLVDEARRLNELADDLRSAAKRRFHDDH